LRSFLESNVIAFTHLDPSFIQLSGFDIFHWKCW